MCGSFHRKGLNNSHNVLLRQSLTKAGNVRCTFGLSTASVLMKELKCYFPVLTIHAVTLLDVHLRRSAQITAIVMANKNTGNDLVINYQMCA